MPLIVPDGYGTAVLHWRNNDGAKSNTVTMGFGDGALVGSDANDCATFIRLAAIDASGPCAAGVMYTAWSFLGVSVIVKDGGAEFPSDDFTTTDGTFTGGSPAKFPLGGYTPYCVSKKTILGGRRYRGRMYWPPTFLAANDIGTSGAIDSTRVSAIQAMFDTFLDNLSTGSPSVAMMLMHESAPSTPTAVSNLVMRDVVATQRRRKNRES